VGDDALKRVATMVAYNKLLSARQSKKELVILEIFSLIKVHKNDTENSVRILALDVGEATIGVAVSDELGWTAQSVTTIRRQGRAKDFRALQALIDEYRPEKLLIGLPKNIDGSMGAHCQKIIEYADELSRRFNIPVVTWDERFSTIGAERYLLESDLSSRKRKKVIDKMAAAFILQGYLNRRSFA
jgi:putative Holliday junction resolvase